MSAVRSLWLVSAVFGFGVLASGCGGGGSSGAAPVKVPVVRPKSFGPPGKCYYVASPAECAREKAPGVPTPMPPSGSPPTGPTTRAARTTALIPPEDDVEYAEQLGTFASQNSQAITDDASDGEWVDQDGNTWDGDFAEDPAPTTAGTTGATTAGTTAATTGATTAETMAGTTAGTTAGTMAGTTTSGEGPGRRSPARPVHDLSEMIGHYLSVRVTYVHPDGHDEHVELVGMVTAVEPLVRVSHARERHPVHPAARPEVLPGRPPQPLRPRVLGRDVAQPPLRDHMARAGAGRFHRRPGGRTPSSPRRRPPEHPPRSCGCGRPVTDDATSMSELLDPAAAPGAAPRAAWEFLEILATVILAAESLRVVGSLVSGIIFGATAHVGPFGNQRLVGSAVVRAVSFSDGPGLVLLLLSFALLWWRAEYWTNRVDPPAGAGTGRPAPRWCSYAASAGWRAGRRSCSRSRPPGRSPSWSATSS